MILAVLSVNTWVRNHAFNRNVRLVSSGEQEQEVRGLDPVGDTVRAVSQRGQGRLGEQLGLEG